MSGVREISYPHAQPVKIRTRRIWLALLLIIAAALVLALRKSPPPQIITLPNGEQ